jgi:hypothetical protein
VAEYTPSLGDVLVATSHDITDAMLDDWNPVSDDESPKDAYRHGVADGVRFLLASLMVGGQNPEEVPFTDDMLEMLEGVMFHFGERNNMKAVLSVEPA